MFYVKEKLSDSAEINIEIHDENVFCRCPKCGCEVPVELADILSDGVSDLFGTAVCCAKCSKEARNGQ